MLLGVYFVKMRNPTILLRNWLTWKIINHLLLQTKMFLSFTDAGFPIQLITTGGYNRPTRVVYRLVVKAVKVSIVSPSPQTIRIYLHFFLFLKSKHFAFSFICCSDFEGINFQCPSFLFFLSST